MLLRYRSLLLKLTSAVLVFGAWEIALVFSLLNLALLAWRIRIEETVLDERRQASG